LIEFLKSKEIQFHSENITVKIKNLDYEKFIPEGFILHPHQEVILDLAKNNNNLIFESATSSGKSLSIYLLIAMLKDKNKNISIIVPNKGLVNQLYSDFNDYGCDFLNDITLVHGDIKPKDIDLSKPIIISTWQSYKKHSPLLAKTCDAIVVDECVHPDTLISTPSGDVKISNLDIGDEIYSFNHSSGLIEIDTVLKLHTSLLDSSSSDFYELTLADDSILFISGNHKAFTINGEKRIDELLLSDEVISIDI
jgi:hypothetical protein